MPPFVLRGALVLALAFWLLPALAQHRIHYTLLEEPARPLPAKLVALNAEITVSEISAGGVVERVPEWTEAASANLTRALTDIASSRHDLSLVATPALTDDETALLEQYIANYFVVGATAHAISLTSDPAWEHKRRRFDYTLGEGLAFLKEKSGADAAVFIVGDDVVSSAERKAVAFVGAFLGVGIGLGRSLVSVGVVDLTSGDLLWMHHTTSIRYDLKDYDSAKAMLAEILASYPGFPVSGR